MIDPSSRMNEKRLCSEGEKKKVSARVTCHFSQRFSTFVKVFVVNNRHSIEIVNSLRMNRKETKGSNLGDT